MPKDYDALTLLEQNQEEFWIDFNPSAFRLHQRLIEIGFVDCIAETDDLIDQLSKASQEVLRLRGTDEPISKLREAEKKAHDLAHKTVRRHQAFLSGFHIIVNEVVDQRFHQLLLRLESKREGHKDPMSTDYIPDILRAALTEQFGEKRETG